VGGGRVHPVVFNKIKHVLRLVQLSVDLIIFLLLATSIGLKIDKFYYMAHHF